MVADASPLHYLILIGEISLLRSLYQEVTVPTTVIVGLMADDAPPSVRAWAEKPPEWIQVRGAPEAAVTISQELGAGEIQAIQIAVAMEAELLICDDGDARLEAERLNLVTIGLLGMLRDSALPRFVDIREALDRLRATNFYVTDELCDRIVRFVDEKSK